MSSTTAEVGKSTGAGTGTTVVDMLRQRLRGQGIFVLLAVTWVLSWSVILLDGNTVSVKRLVVPAVGLGIIAAGHTLVIVAGSIDLSVAWLVTVCAMFAASVADGDAGKLPMTIALTILIGALVGLANGLIITGLKVHGFVATLGMALMLQGVVAQKFAKNSPAKMPDSIVQSLGFGSIGPVPWSTVLLVGVMIVMAWLLGRTRTGAHIYAVGGGGGVARLSGIRAGRAVIAAHVVCGMCTAVAGIYLASRLGTPNVEIGSTGVYDLESIAVVVLGGAALAGGKGRISATFAAMLVFVLIDDAFSQLGVNPYLKLVVRGAIIIAAVASYTVRSGEEAK